MEETHAMEGWFEPPEQAFANHGSKDVKTLVAEEKHTVRHDLRVDLKALAGVLKAKKCSFGKAEDIGTLLGVTPGAVAPLAAINDTGSRLRVVLDKARAEYPSVNIHPLRNTATSGLSGQDLQRALAHWNHPAIIAEIPGRP